MRILFAEDSKIHQDHFLMSIKTVCDELKKPLEILSVAENGDQLFNNYKKFTQSAAIDYVFSDIRMPEVDGLTALVKIRNLNPKQKIIMVSSEDVDKMNLLIHQHGNTENKDIDVQKKFELINKIVTRICSGKIEEGKLNNILEGCEKLALDPILAAKHLGASGYIQKPYDIEKLKKALLNLDQLSAFFMIR